MKPIETLKLKVGQQLLIWGQRLTRPRPDPALIKFFREPAPRPGIPVIPAPPETLYTYVIDHEIVEGRTRPDGRPLLAKFKKKLITHNGGIDWLEVSRQRVWD